MFLGQSKRRFRKANSLKINTVWLLRPLEPSIFPILNLRPMINRKFFATLLFVLFIYQGFAQKPPIKFGKVSMDEMKMTVYDKDTTAEAVVLADYGDARIVFGADGYPQLSYNKHIRVKVLNTDGLHKADIVVRLYRKDSDKETLSGLKAVTYNLENGKIVTTKLSKKDVYNEEESKNWKLVKFALPNVKEGSVFEYKYEMKSPFIYTFQTWYFQDDIPVVWSEYRTSIPEYYNFKNVFGGYISPAISETGSAAGKYTTSRITRSGMYVTKSKSESYSVDFTNHIKRWVFNDVPAFKDEKFITTPRDYLAKVEFELQSTHFPGSMVKSYSKTWDKIVAELMTSEHFGTALNRKGIVKELTEQINPADPPEKKIAMAYDLIKKQIKWNGKNSIYANTSLRATFNKNEGNTAEINLLLVNLLRSVGIEAHPVLISTRSHGKIKQFYPRLTSFNSVIALAKINDKSILMDATSAYLKPGELPRKDINGKGLVAIKDKTYWVRLLSSEKSYKTRMVLVSVRNKQLTAQIQRGYKSLSATSKRVSIAKEGKEKYIENFKEKNSDWEIIEYEIKNENDITKTLTEKIIANNFDNIDVEDDIIYLPAVLAEGEDENPFKSDTREYPVDFATPMFEKNIIVITIPEGYQVDELPKPTKVVLPNNDASFVYNAVKKGPNIQVVTQTSIKKTLFLPQEYQLLKELFRNIIEKQGEQIVLKRIEE
jgi:hypothetical protein